MAFSQDIISRRAFLKSAAGGVLVSLPFPFGTHAEAASGLPNHLFWVTRVPDDPFQDTRNVNYHAGVDTLLRCMGSNGLKFFHSARESLLSGPSGMIRTNDVVLIKVNAQWKYRGCTNSDLVRGLIQRILDGHPDGFRGEVVIIENGQGRGSLNCDTSSGYQNGGVHANANDPTHSFVYLVDRIFNDPRVSYYLLDDIRNNWIFDPDDHVTDGYRFYENVSYPCFTTLAGNRVELREGIWRGDRYAQNLKLINVPVLKHHDEGGSEITASLKHCYGILNMSDGQSNYRHYSGLGETCGKMIASVRTPVLNIVDAIWVSHGSLSGYPASTTFRANQIMASQDPVALDYCAAKRILYPFDRNPRHHPRFAGISRWLTDARNTINARGGLYDKRAGIFVRKVTTSPEQMVVFRRRCPAVVPALARESSLTDATANA